MKLTYLHEFLELFLALDKSVQKQLKKKLDDMARSELKAFAHQSLEGKQFKGLYKYRAGDWRMIYKISDTEVLFITLGHRREVYKK